MFETNKIYCGDAVAVMKTWPDACIQTVVTSPPYYGLRDYGIEGQMGLEDTPDLFVAGMVSVFREIRRILTKDGTLWLNLGDSYANNGSGGHGATGGREKSTLAGPLPPIGTNPINKKIPVGLKPKDLCGIPWRVALALQSDGWFLRSDIIWSKPNPMPESVVDRPTKAHEYIFLMSKSSRYHYDAEAIKEKAIGWNGSNFDNPRDLEIHPNVGRGERNKKPSGWHNGQGNSRDLTGRYSHGKWSEQDPQSTGARIVERVAEARANGSDHESPFGETRNKRSVWEVPTQGFPGAHFATFPEDLIVPCIKAGSRQGDVVLDPFMGSGTVAVVAKRLGRRYVGTELNPAYIKLAEDRIAREGTPLLVE